ncbi:MULTISPECIES: class I adenylate-forming enzyme family protein [Streptomyces]|uniref:class I adenylate-forming enzyme family protein n=1 Tax=Streptomyces TaxID=1883 RepID=UPI0004AA5EB5|nr:MULTISPECIES: class I adenylate-forming enzyme family protein [Streptomyces]
MPTLLHDLLDGQSARSPDAAAIRRRETVWTFAELRQRSLRYAAALAAAGVGRGDRVVIVAPHAPETAAAVFAVSRLGAIYVVASDRTPRAQLVQVLLDCTPKVLVSPEVTPELAFEDVTNLAFDTLEAGPAEPLPPAGTLSVDPVGLLYTSGSTALPKGVISTHAQVLFAAEAIQSRLGYRSTDVVFCCLPLSFDYGLYQVYLSMLAGSCLVLSDESEAGPALVRMLDHYEATVLPLVAPLATTLALLVARQGRMPLALRMVTNTGARLHDSLAEQLRRLIPGLDVVSMFGLTECKRVTIADPNDDLLHPGTCGRALPDTEIFVVDSNGDRLPPGEVGELVVRGPHVMAGYWGEESRTSIRFRTDNYGRRALYTGDQCRIDAEGNLYFVGRRDEVYKQSGFRVSAAEVEAAAQSVPGVRLAAVLPPTSDRGAVLVVTGDVAPHEVLAELTDRLERHKVPSECHVIEQFELNSNGKINKRLLLAALSPSAPSRTAV